MPFFPTAPGYRMALDLDGTVVFEATAGTPTYPGYEDILNAEAIGPFMAGSYVGWIFPEARDIQGYYVASLNGGAQDLEVSSDTTNGVDGTWTVVAAGTFPQGAANAYFNGAYRSDAQTLSETNMVGIRCTGNDRVYIFHVYGVAHSGANPDRLEIWDPSSDIKLGIEALDPGTDGDVQRGQSYTRTFRVKNLSSTLTAIDTVVSASVLSDNSPSVIAGINFDIGGGPAPTVTIATLNPGDISAVITMTYDVAANAQIHTANPRVTAVPSTYS